MESPTLRTSRVAIDIEPREGSEELFLALDYAGDAAAFPTHMQFTEGEGD